MPVKLLGILVAGLRDDSRIVQKMNGVKANDTQLLLASIFDGVNMLLWARTKDAEKGRNKPKSYAESLFVKDKKTEVQVYESAESFDKERERILKEIENAR